MAWLLPFYRSTWPAICCIRPLAVALIAILYSTLVLPVLLPHTLHAVRCCGAPPVVYAPARLALMDMAYHLLLPLPVLGGGIDIHDI